MTKSLKQLSDPISAETGIPSASTELRRGCCCVVVAAAAAVYAVDDQADVDDEANGNDDKSSIYVPPIW